MLWLTGYVACIVAANVLITVVGFVPVGFGLMAPAGVFAAGAALTLRDKTQDALGRRWTLAAILIGAALSALLSPALALASGTAFLLSELADFAVYTPLRRRGWALAVLASNVVGLVIDSTLFLWLAFGNLAFLGGQIFGKIEITLLTVALLWAWRTLRRRPAGVAAA